MSLEVNKHAKNANVGLFGFHDFNARSSESEVTHFPTVPAAWKVGDLAAGSRNMHQGACLAWSCGSGDLMRHGGNQSGKKMCLLNEITLPPAASC